MPLVIAVIVPEHSLGWHGKLVQRLRHAGHRVSVTRAGHRRRSALDLILAFEALRFGPGLAAESELEMSPQPKAADLTLDLAGGLETRGGRCLSILFNGRPTLDATAKAILAGGQPLIEIIDGGRIVASAAPMVSDRIWLTRSLDDVLVRALDLLERSVRLPDQSQLLPLVQPLKGNGLAARYWLGLVPKLAIRLSRKLRYKPFHWRVGYRMHPEPLTGLGFDATADGYATKPDPAWIELPEDGSRFYADPFPVAVDGRYWLFVEEFPHATGKGIISVTELGLDGALGPVRPVLEEPFHLSYPQVFAHDGQWWMIPEGAGGHDLVLYRAETFPDRWVRHATLLESQLVADATLLQHDGTFWLFAADGGQGSASDSLLVFHAPALTGPYQAHVANPILIDKTSARPAGAFILGGPHPILPVQDGTAGYGSGMGLVEVLELSPERVRLGPVRPLATPGWPLRFKHTTNRTGRLEVVDGVVLQRR